MMTRPRFRARTALYCAPLLVLIGCPVEERTLDYGVAVTAGSASNATPQPGNAGSADRNGESGASPIADGGDAAQAGASARALTDGGSPPESGGDGNHPLSQAGTPPSGGTGGGGGSSPGGSAGTGGAQPDGGPCGDLDQNGVQDCDETLVANSAFNTDVQKWDADPSMTTAWQSSDARGAQASGSMSLKFVTPTSGQGWAIAAAGQCIQAWGEQGFELGARVFIPKDQAGGNAQIGLVFLGEDDCAGSFLGTTTPALTTQAGAWQVLRTSARLPAGTRSALVRLAVTKPGTQASLEAHFDSVLFRLE